MTEIPCPMGRYGVFEAPDCVGVVGWKRYHDSLFSPLQMIATAADEHAAAKAACVWLAQLDRHCDATRSALVIRDRHEGRNIALIQWVQRFNTAGHEYRYSRETWASEPVGVPCRSGRERRREV